MLGLGLQAPNEDGQPPAYQSVLLVTGLLLLYGALLQLADLARRGGLLRRLPGGGATWTSLVVAGAALYAAVFGAARRSAC